MGEIIFSREFVKVITDKSFHNRDNLWELRGERCRPPLMFIDEVDGWIFNHMFSTPHHDFYKREKYDG